MQAAKIDETFLGYAQTPNYSQPRAQRYTPYQNVRHEPYRAGRRGESRRSSNSGSLSVLVAQVKGEISKQFSEEQNNDNANPDMEGSNYPIDSGPPNDNSTPLSESESLKESYPMSNANSGDDIDNDNRHPPSSPDGNDQESNANANIKFEPDDDSNDIEITSIEAGTPRASMSQEAWGSGVSMATGQDMGGVIDPSVVHEADQMSKCSHFLHNSPLQSKVYS